MLKSDIFIGQKVGCYIKDLKGNSKKILGTVLEFNTEYPDSYINKELEDKNIIVKRFKSVIGLLN